jgi:hypothetical protein
MIIFDLDGTLADCEHRRHFIEPLHPKNIDNAEMLSYNAFTGELVKAIGWKPDWKSFYEACDKDNAVWPSINILNRMLIDGGEEINIWSGRCESVKDKTVSWLKDYLDCDAWFYRDCLKMRPIVDSTPDYVLKEKWLDETLTTGKTIDYAFDDRPKVVRMWRRRGIFVFNCLQHDREF